MDEKSKKTLFYVIIAVLLVAGVIFVLVNLWKFVLGGVVGLAFGYYFGYTRGKGKRLK